MRKVKLKQWVKDYLNIQKGINTGRTCTIQMTDDSIHYSKDFALAEYFTVSILDVAPNRYKIIEPEYLENLALAISHTEPFDMFPELDKAFEWE